MRRAIFNFILWPLIKRDLRFRMAGMRPDRFYWADMLAIRLGMLTWYRMDEVK